MIAPVVFFTTDPWTGRVAALESPAGWLKSSKYKGFRGLRRCVDWAMAQSLE